MEVEEYCRMVFRYILVLVCYLLLHKRVISFIFDALL